MIPPVLFFLLATTPRRLEVCLSPGCVADGGKTCLERLQALAPYDVEEGGCVSLCGKGPVVIVPSEDDDDSKRVIHRRVSGDVMLKLLEDLEANVPAELVQGYDLVSEAHELEAKKKYDAAVPLYQEGVRVALDTAKSIEGGSLVWLSKALRSLATSQLALFEKEAALESIEEALKLDGDDFLSLECKAQVCQALKDTKGELEALQAYFALPEPENPPRDVANRRRTWGFRLQKLEREAGS